MKLYDLIIIGGGSAGLTAAELAGDLGLHTALVEKNKIGGDCTWTGCIPSKALLQTAGIAHSMKSAADYGLPMFQPRVDISEVMAKVKQIINDIYQEESPSVLRETGLDVYLTGGEFLDNNTLLTGDRETIRGKRILIATGAHPEVPAVDGLQSVPFLTYETIWDIERLPNRLLVLGGGTVGVELGQAFQRLGSEVTIIEAQNRILPELDPAAVEVLQNHLVGEGVKISVNWQADNVYQRGEEIVLSSGENQIAGDVLLVSTGRRPNVNGLALEKAGIEFDSNGIRVDKHMRTSQPHIFAAGDCTGGPQFTHVAGWQAYIALRNAFLPGSSSGELPRPVWTLFTDPEIAQVGYTYQEARQRYGSKVIRDRRLIQQIDRSVTDRAGEGFLEVITLPNRQVIGAIIISPRAGELIHEWVLAITHRLKIDQIAFALHSYPTYALGNMQLAADITSRRMLGGIQGKLIRLLTRF